MTTLTIANVDDPNDGNFGSDLIIPVGLLYGDANRDPTVNSGDATVVRNWSGYTADADHFRGDLNLDGVINSGDATVVRSRSGNFIP